MLFKRSIKIALIGLLFILNNVSSAENRRMYSFRPVSITAVPGGFLTVDYQFIWFVDPATGSLFQVPAINENNRDNEKIYYLSNINPAGIFSFNDIIYIANYHFKNVLIGRLENNKLIISKKLEHHKFVSPEGVAVNDKYIAVADYDASMVFIFDKGGNILIEHPLPLAHGVAIKGDVVFASGLGGDSLISINVKNKDIKKSITKMRYPTTIQISPDGDVVVIDANAAQLIFFDALLNQKISISIGSGSDISKFLRPYGFVFSDDSIVITDTGKNRMVKLKFKSEYNDKFDVVPISSINAPIFFGAKEVEPMDSRGCFNYSQVESDIDALAKFFGFDNGKITSCTQGLEVEDVSRKRHFLALPIFEGLPLNFVWITSKNSVFILGDPTSRYLYSIDIHEKECKFIELPVDLKIFKPDTYDAKSLIFQIIKLFPTQKASCEPIARWAI